MNGQRDYCNGYLLYYDYKSIKFPESEISGIRDLIDYNPWRDGWWKIFEKWYDFIVPQKGKENDS